MKQLIQEIEEMKKLAKSEETKIALEHVQNLIKQEQAQLKSVLEKYI